MDLGFADICPMNPVEIVMELMLQEVDMMVAWAFKVPGFRELDREDRANLFSSGKLTKLAGWQSAESTYLSSLWPVLKSWRRRHMWVEFVVSFLLCSERFISGYAAFSSPQKPTFPHSNSTRNHAVGRRTTKWMCYPLIVIYLLIDLLFI